jgi:hypothetical protein
LPSQHDLRNERAPFEHITLCEYMGKIDFAVSIKRIRLNDPCAVAIKKKLEAPHFVQRVPY